MLAVSITKMIHTLPERGIEVATWNGYALGTLGAITNQFIYHFNRDAVHVCWFERMEWLSRLGVVSLIPDLQEEITLLAESIENGICNAVVDPVCFKGWGPYVGLQLEVDWKKKVRKQCDITFRALLILYYSFFTI